MGNLAAMLKEIGHEVSGSDGALYPPMSTQLKKWGIKARKFSARNVGAADLYVIGNAISRGNPEVEVILNRGLEYTSMSECLARFFLRGKQVIVIAGTHGKTTTSFLTDHVLTQTLGEAPGLFVGGVRGDGMAGFRVSKSPYFVVEGDEYDTAFFDKASKFLHYRPRYLLLTSVEFDHADIFTNFREYKKSFRLLLRMIPAQGLVVACQASAGVRDVLKDYRLSPIRWYGASRPEKIEREFIHTNAEELPLIGKHNLQNASAVLGLCQALRIAPEKFREAVKTFPGVLRRQQVRLELRREAEDPLTFIEDFAHHPTAVKETIAAVRRTYSGRRIHVLFEPRSATSHRNIFQKRYAGALAKADQAYICEVFNPQKFKKSELLDVPGLVADLKAARKERSRGNGPGVYYGQNPLDVLGKFKANFRSSPRGDVVLAMSNGAFGGIYPEMEKFLRRK